MNLEQFYTYPTVYHQAVNHLISHSRYGGDTLWGRKLIARSLRLFRLDSRKRAQWERQHMLSIAGGFPVKNRSVVVKSSNWKSSQDGCPECGGDNLIFDSFDQVQFGELLQEVACPDCETSWTEVYRLTCITDLDTTGFVREDCAIYARVSTADQSTEPQELDLRAYAKARGWKVYSEYCDSGISGTKDSRPALNDLMNNARKRRFDVVLVWRFDRFARSTRHLVLALEEFRNLGIEFVSYQENIDTSDTTHK